MEYVLLLREGDRYPLLPAICASVARGGSGAGLRFSFERRFEGELGQSLELYRVSGR
jgi:hypothetical protein